MAATGHQTVTYSTGHTREVFWMDGTCYDIGEHRKICARPMRGGRICNMDRDHRGRCCSVAWRCDACNRTQRGAVYSWGDDGEYPHSMRFCFVCVGIRERNAWW
jgi:hypothetical protein